jgi:hypothetical protein
MRNGAVKIDIHTEISTQPTWHRKGTSRRFTMKPGVSPHCTTLLPILVPNSATAFTVAASVCLVLITSTSFMICTGLKK